jgi:hypothetical protein
MPYAKMGYWDAEYNIKETDILAISIHRPCFTRV